MRFLLRFVGIVDHEVVLHGDNGSLSVACCCSTNMGLVRCILLLVDHFDEWSALGCICPD